MYNWPFVKPVLIKRHFRELVEWTVLGFKVSSWLFVKGEFCKMDRKYALDGYIRDHGKWLRLKLSGLRWKVSIINSWWSMWKTCQTALSCSVELRSPRITRSDWYFVLFAAHPMCMLALSDIVFTFNVTKELALECQFILCCGHVSHKLGFFG